METALTIIMSNYNQEKYIAEAIDSVLMQKVNFKYQLLITDDNSTKDKSLEIIREYENKYPDKIKVLYNKENGKYLTNILRAKAITKTPYFCLLDADDYWSDDGYLQRAYDFLEKNPDYVIYYENINKLYSDNSFEPYIKSKIKTCSYDINDYLNDKLPVVQTTGQFYRNVIFINGIPEIMTSAVGTVSERSFEGDYDRFIMHLKYGKVYFNNRICGVYRILPNAGIWAKLNIVEKHLIQMQSLYDYNRYYNDEYKSFFVNKMYYELREILKKFTDCYLNFDTFKLKEEELKQLNNLYDYLICNKKNINFPKKKIYDFTIKEIIKKILRRS
ncbi:Glycosyl transferase family 2 [Treponema berlinense]|uniref:Glycosyl transferase family 2 n=1 Tax=Treponema berlinense TaxID=225004 RepID=A0A1T4MJ05_9SPIR|nr:glycosyltransferase family 2 protein [Treponema berlinense]SJZ66738.1 Glycosyl transferase family 2 [Treponema berlinense]